MDSKHVMLTPVELLSKTHLQVPSDMLLTYVADIDDNLMALEQLAASLKDRKAKLLKRAATEKIREDAFAFIIEIPGNSNRNPISGSMVRLFETTYPDAYERVRARQLKEMTDKYSEATSTLIAADIPLTFADKELGQDTVSKFTGYQPTKYTTKVVRKPEVITP